MRINGFRPGKVPVAHLRRVYGRSVMADVVQNAVNEANRKIVDDNGLKLALEPQIQFPEDKDEVEAGDGRQGRSGLQGRARGAADFELADLSDVKVKKPVAEVAGRRGRRSARAHGQAEPHLRGQEARGRGRDGDRVVVDFVGRIDGEEFEGGKGEDIQVELGSNTFIPGFEDQLVGVKAGDEPARSRSPSPRTTAPRTSPARTPSST